MTGRRSGLRTLSGVLVLGLLVTSGYFFLPREEIISAFASFGSLRPHEWAVLFSIQVFTLVLSGSQWALLLRVDGRRLPLLPVISRYLAGNVVESVTPSSKLGGESVRAVLFHQGFGIPYRRIAVAATVRALSLYLTLAILLVVLALSYVRMVATALGAIVILVSTVLLGLLCAVRRGLVLPPASDTTYLFASSLLLWVLYPIKLALVAVLIGTPLSFSLVVSATYGAYLLGLIPLTPGGLGVYEAGMTGILVAGGISPGDALLLTLTLRIVTFWWPLVLSILAGTVVFGSEGTHRSRGVPQIYSTCANHLQGSRDISENTAVNEESDGLQA